MLYRRLLGLLGILLVGAGAAVAQGTQVVGANTVVSGTVQVESEDRDRKPVEHALVEVYSRDRGGRWSTHTDKHGNYSVSLPTFDSYLIVVSGPGLAPLWDNNLILRNTPIVNFIVYPGPGNRLSLAEIQERRALGQSRRVYTPSLEGTMFTVTSAYTEEERSKYFDGIRNESDAVRRLRELKIKSDNARETYDSGIWLKVAGDYRNSLEAFTKLLVEFDRSDDEYFAKLARNCLVNIAEAHFLMGVQLYNKGFNDQAQPEFKEAVSFGKRFIERAQKLQSQDSEAKTFLLISNKIIANSSLDLVKLMGAPDFEKTGLDAADRASELDPPNKSDYKLLRAKTITAAGDRAGAISEYKSILQWDQNNIEALYEVSLLLVQSGSTAELQAACEYLKRFIQLAPAGDDRIDQSKQAIASVCQSTNALD